MVRPRPSHWIVVAALVTAAVLGTASMASAAFSSATSATHTIATATLEPPSNPAATAGPCTATSDSVVVSWTKTPSTWADGYEVLSSLTTGGPYTVAATVTGRDTESVTVSGLLFDTTYYLVVRATKEQWRSSVTTEVAHKTRLLCA